MNPSIIGRVNPYKSPLYRGQTFIRDKKLYFRWASVKKYITSKTVPMVENNGMLKIDLEDGFLIAKNSPKFRPIGILDWAHYTPKQLALAIDNGYMQYYYEYMLNDKRSDANIWSDPFEEQMLKDYYRKRAGK